MIFDVMSERAALAFAAEEDILACVLISIRNVGDPDLAFPENPQIKAILPLKFYDSSEELPGSMTEADAEAILDFVEQWQTKVEQIVIHCAEGVSRSAGIAAALMEHLNGEADEILRDPRRYHPNQRCYRLLREAIERRGGKRPPRLL